MVLPIAGKTTLSLAANLDIGLITVASATLLPIFPTVNVGLYIPYLKPKASPLPTSGIPPPIRAPSCPYFNLLIIASS